MRRSISASCYTSKILPARKGKRTRFEWLATQMRNCARFERLHSSRNAMRGASLSNEVFEAWQRTLLSIERRKADFFQKVCEARICFPEWNQVRSRTEGVHASVALLIREFEGGEGVILLVQTCIDVGDSQPGNIFRSCFLNQLAKNFSSFLGLAGSSESISKISAEIGRFWNGMNSVFHLRDSLVKFALSNQKLSVAIVGDGVTGLHVERFADLLFGVGMAPGIHE